MHASWSFLQQEATELVEQLAGWGKVYPPHPLRCLEIDRADVRVIVLGNRPYPNRKATGLCFAVPSWCSRWPPELQAIADSIAIDTGERLVDGTLESLEQQGVLFLSVQLATKGKWARITSDILNACPKAVVIAMGSRAQRHARAHASGLVLAVPHPSLSLKTTAWSRCNMFIEGEPLRWGKRI